MLRDLVPTGEAILSKAVSAAFACRTSGSCVIS